MPLAVGYMRLSSKRQCTPEAKAEYRAGIQTYIADNPKHDLQWVRNYEDWGLSGWSGAHREGQFGQMKRDIERGELPLGTWIIVRNMDRLGRDDIDRANHEFSGLLVAKMTIVTVMDGHIYRGGNGDLSRQLMDLMYSLMLQARSNEESGTKSVRRASAAAKARAKAAADKTIIKGACPAWLRIEGDRHVVIDDAALLVRRVYQMFVSGVGCGKIARMLNDEGVLSIGRSGEWSSTYIRLLLSNRAVTGRVQFGKRNRDTQGKRVLEGEAIEGYYPPIISMELWDRAQRVSADRARVVEGGNCGMFKQTAGTPNLLAGIAKCGSCGGPMIRHIGHNDRAYLRCDFRVQRRGCPNSSHVRLRELEGVVVARCALALIQPALPLQPQPELEELRREIAGGEQTVERLLDDAVKQPVAAVRDKLYIRIAKIDTTIAAARTCLAEAERTAAHLRQDTSATDRERLLNTLKGAFQDDDDDARVQVAGALRRVVDRLEVHQDKTITLSAMSGSYSNHLVPHVVDGEHRYRPLKPPTPSDVARLPAGDPRHHAALLDVFEAILAGAGTDGFAKAVDEFHGLVENGQPEKGSLLIG